MKRLMLPLCFFIIAAVLLCGALFSGGQHYYLTACTILILSFAAMLIRFERRKVRAREMVLLAVMTALAVAGRAVFFLLPQMKPTAALVILAGAAFGAEPGFLVGATTALVSNFFFGQGPWTPFQMFALGMVGLFAGLLFKKRTKNRIVLSAYGALSVLFLYGLVVNAGTFLTAMPSDEPLSAAFLAVLASGIWFDLMHAVSTAAFLFLLTKPFAAKLTRISKKYGVFQ